MHKAHQLCARGVSALPDVPARKRPGPACQRPHNPSFTPGRGVYFCPCAYQASRQSAGGARPRGKAGVPTAHSNGVAGMDACYIREGPFASRRGEANGEAISKWGEGMEERFEYIRCLFCITGKEREAARALEQIEGVRAIFPRKLKPIWKKTDWEDEERPLFPGYVFVYAHRPLRYAELCKDANVLRPLAYDTEGKEPYLNENDRRFAELLLRTDGLVGALDAIEEGSYVRISEGALRAINGRVTKVDKRKRLARVDIDILGDTRSVWLAFRLLENDVQSLTPNEKETTTPPDGAEKEHDEKDLPAL